MVFVDVGLLALRLPFEKCMVKDRWMKTTFPMTAMTATFGFSYYSEL